MFWILLGTFLVAKAIGGYLEYHSTMKQHEIRSRILAKPLTITEIEQADIDDSRSLSEAEFVLYKLQAMGILSGADVEKVNRKFHRELNPGEDGEVQIPTKEVRTRAKRVLGCSSSQFSNPTQTLTSLEPRIPQHVDQCFKDGQDFNFAMKSYQDKIKEEEKEKKENERKEVAKSNLSKRKLGLYAGALNKIKRTIKECPKNKLKSTLDDLLENDDIVCDLPEVENDDDEIEQEIQEIIFVQAKAKLKDIQDSQGGSSSGIDRTNTSVQNAAASLIAKLKSRRGTDGQKSPTRSPTRSLTASPQP